MLGLALLGYPIPGDVLQSAAVLLEFLLDVQEQDLELSCQFGKPGGALSSYLCDADLHAILESLRLRLDIAYPTVSIAAQGLQRCLQCIQTFFRGRRHLATIQVQ